MHRESGSGNPTDAVPALSGCPVILLTPQSSATLCVDGEGGMEQACPKGEVKAFAQS